VGAGGGGGGGSRSWAAPHSDDLQAQVPAVQHDRIPRIRRLTASGMPRRTWRFTKVGARIGGGGWRGEWGWGRGGEGQTGHNHHQNTRRQLGSPSLRCGRPRRVGGARYWHERKQKMQRFGVCGGRGVWERCPGGVGGGGGGAGGWDLGARRDRAAVRALGGGGDPPQHRSCASPYSPREDSCFRTGQTRPYVARRRVTVAAIKRARCCRPTKLRESGLHQVKQTKTSKNQPPNKKKKKTQQWERRGTRLRSRTEAWGVVGGGGVGGGGGRVGGGGLFDHKMFFLLGGDGLITSPGAQLSGRTDFLSGAGGGGGWG